MTIGTYVCQFQLLVLFSEKEEWLTYLCMVTRGPRPSEVLMAYVVISCAQLLTNCCTSSPSGLCPQHVGPRRAAVIPSASESLCNFGEIYTQKNLSDSFLFRSPSLSLLPLPFWFTRITSLTPPPAWYHSMHRLWELVPPLYSFTSLFSACQVLVTDNAPEFSTKTSPSCYARYKGLIHIHKHTQSRFKVAASLYWYSSLQWDTMVGHGSLYRALKKARRPVSGDGCARSFWICQHSLRRGLVM